MTARDRSEPLRIQLVGGLGNQLFQYAAARAAALQLGCTLEVEVVIADQEVPGQTPREFALQWLVPPDGIVGGVRSSRLVQRLMRTFPRAVPRGTFVEAGFPYDPRILAIRPGTTLIGYFQSWRYFADCADLVRSELLQSAPRSPWFDDTAAELADLGDWTSVHIRRGDYTTPRNGAFHGLLGAAYYRTAIAEVSRHLPLGPLVVFSDEPESALSILQDTSLNVVLVQPPEDAHPMESIRLMAGASAIITANSSFSWWGAWLADPDVPVVCPNRWFKGAKHDERDLRPTSWLSVPADFETPSR